MTEMEFSEYEEEQIEIAVEKSEGLNRMIENIGKAFIDKILEETTEEERAVIKQICKAIAKKVIIKRIKKIRNVDFILDKALIEEIVKEIKNVSSIIGEAMMEDIIKKAIIDANLI